MLFFHKNFKLVVFVIAFFIGWCIGHFLVTPLIASADNTLVDSRIVSVPSNNPDGTSYFTGGVFFRYSVSSDVTITELRMPIVRRNLYDSALCGTKNLQIYKNGVLESLGTVTKNEKYIDVRDSSDVLYPTLQYTTDDSLWYSWVLSTAYTFTPGNSYIVGFENTANCRGIFTAPETSYLEVYSNDAPMSPRADAIFAMYNFVVPPTSTSTPPAIPTDVFYFSVILFMGMLVMYGGFHVASNDL